MSIFQKCEMSDKRLVEHLSFGSHNNDPLKMVSTHIGDSHEKILNFKSWLFIER